MCFENEFFEIPQIQIQYILQRKQKGIFLVCLNISKLQEKHEKLIHQKNVYHIIIVNFSQNLQWVHLCQPLPKLAVRKHS